MSSVLMPSSRDKVCLTQQVVTRLGMFAAKLRERKQNMEIPKNLLREFGLFNQMRRRYDREGALMGIYLHSQDEANAEQTICCWLVEEWKQFSGVKL